MSTAPAAQQAAKRYIDTSVAGTVDRVEFVGMTMTPDGRRLGFEVEFDRGTSVTGAIFGGLLLGLLALLLGLLFGLVLALVGFPPGLLFVLGALVTVGGVVSGARAGADASEVENLTVTIDDAGDVTMVNRDLSAGEFSRAIDRQYDRQTTQFDDAVAQVSKHWLLHKVASRYLGSGSGNDD